MGRNESAAAADPAVRTADPTPEGAHHDHAIWPVSGGRRRRTSGADPGNARPRRRQFRRSHRHPSPGPDDEERVRAQRRRSALRQPGHQRAALAHLVLRLPRGDERDGRRRPRRPAVRHSIRRGLGPGRGCLFLDELRHARVFLRRLAGLRQRQSHHVGHGRALPAHGAGRPRHGRRGRRRLLLYHGLHGGSPGGDRAPGGWAGQGGGLRQPGVGDRGRRHSLQPADAGLRVLLRVRRRGRLQPVRCGASDRLHDRGAVHRAHRADGPRLLGAERAVRGRLSLDRDGRHDRRGQWRSHRVDYGGGGRAR